MTREYTQIEIEAMNLAADREDGEGDDGELIRLMALHYYGFGTIPTDEALAGMGDLAAIVRAYDAARREA